MILIVCLKPTQLFSWLMCQPAHYTPLLGYDFVRVLTTSGMFLSWDLSLDFSVRYLHDLLSHLLQLFACVSLARYGYSDQIS